MNCTDKRKQHLGILKAKVISTTVVMESIFTTVTIDVTAADTPGLYLYVGMDDDVMVSFSKIAIEIIVTNTTEDAQFLRISCGVSSVDNQSDVTSREYVL